MPTSFAKGLRPGARDTEAVRRVRDTDATSRGSDQTDGRAVRRSSLLGRAPIRTKLVLILLVPLLAVGAFGGLRIWHSTADGALAQGVQEMVILSGRASDLGHQLQQERALAASHLIDKNTDTEAAYQRQFGMTNSATQALLKYTTTIDLSGRKQITDRLERIRSQVRSLSGVRASVGDADRDLASMSFFYSTVINDLLSLVEQLAAISSEVAALDRISNDRSLDNRIRALAALARVKEYAAQEHVLLLRVLGGSKRFDGAGYRAFLGTLTSQEAYLRQFANSATPDQQRLLRERMGQQQVRESAELENQALRTGPDTTLTIDKEAWSAAMTARLGVMRTVQDAFAARILQGSVAVRDAATRNTIITVLTVLLVVILAMTVSLLVTRSMVRPLVRLRSSALAVAYESLPEVVRKLQDNDLIEPAESKVRPVDIGSSDEIGQVAEAFNAVHQEAVRVAAEQAQLRQGVSAMFVNLARRSQLLVDRLIRLIDSLEQGERDPDRLAELFKVDHLATRMRRNDENLMVLAGADAGRRWTRPAPLIDVLRAATAEVEQYTRVKLGEVDGSVEVSAAAVNDLVHLIAELLENATSFSSPRTDVIVDARRAGDETIIEIEDQGIGISRDQLAEFNERLAKPPIFDVTVSRMMGLYVVGRLASRHGIKVMLRSSASGGVLAIVTVPSTALELSRTSTTTPRASQQRPTRPAVTPADPPPPAAAPPPEAPGSDRRARHVTATMVPAMREPTDEAAPVQPQPPLDPATDIPAPRTGHRGDEPTSAYRSVEAPTSAHRPIDVPAVHEQDRDRRSGRHEPPVEPTAPPPRPAEPATGLPSRPVAPGEADNGRATAGASFADRLRATTPTFGYTPSDPPNSDPTIEIALPIFEQMESEWFRTRHAAARASRPADTAPADATGAGAPAGRHTREPSPPGLAPAAPATPPASAAPAAGADDEHVGPAAPEESGPRLPEQPTPWRSPADIGWEKARAAAQPTITATTETGLPKRVPMAHFVPGHVEQAARPPARPGTHRSPEAVRGVLSSYRSGLEQGRQAKRRSGTALAGSRDEQEEM